MALWSREMMSEVRVRCNERTMLRLKECTRILVEMKLCQEHVEKDQNQATVSSLKGNLHQPETFLASMLSHSSAGGLELSPRFTIPWPIIDTFLSAETTQEKRDSDHVRSTCVAVGCPISVVHV